MSENKNYIKCMICGKRVIQLSQIHFKGKSCQAAQDKKNLDIKSVSEYKIKFPEAPITSPLHSILIWKARKKNDPDDAWAKRGIKTRHENDPDGNCYKKTVETRQKLYGPSGWKHPKQVWITRRKRYGSMGVSDPEEFRRVQSEAMINGKSKIIVEKWRANDPDNLRYVKTWETRRKRYGPTGIKNPERNSKIRAKITRERINKMTKEEKRTFLKKTIYKGNLRPNISEQFILDNVKGLGFKYNGRGPKFINGKVPDFVHSEKSLIIEFDGVGGHDPDLPWVPDNIGEIDYERNKMYRKNGYKILSLNESDIEFGSEYITTKVENWVSCLDAFNGEMILRR